jgi:hypothetical protein
VVLCFLVAAVVGRVVRCGAVMNEEKEAYNIILLNSIKKRVEFPDLKDKLLANA